MSDKTQAGRRVSPLTMLGGRASFAYLNGVAIVVTDVKAWTDDDVMQLVNEQAKLVGFVSAKANITHFFGEVFGATHRRMIVDWIDANGMNPSSRTAMVTDSKIMRAALTAYSWLTKTESKAFEPKDRKAMCEWVASGLQVNPRELQADLEKCYSLLGKTV